MLKNKKLWIIIGTAAVIAVIVWLTSDGKKEEKVSFETAKVEKQDIHTSLCRLQLDSKERASDSRARQNKPHQ